MNNRRYKLPSSNTLIAFESVARLKQVTRAAQELNTSQSAISRHIRQLEDHLSVKLFEKSGRGIILTQAGQSYLTVIQPALNSIHSAGVLQRTSHNDITIACTHEVAHLLIMPVYDQLRVAAGVDTTVKIMTCEYDFVPEMIHAGADITFEYKQDKPEQVSAPILHEQIVPICSAEFLNSNQHTLNSPVTQWGSLCLLALSKNNFGWATWDNWFEKNSFKPGHMQIESYSNYVYLLEAARAGRGLALGWRGFIEQYLEDGTLVTACGSWQRFPASLYAILSTHASSKPAANRCLEFLSASYFAKRS